jgi:hypothetical protein
LIGIHLDLKYPMPNKRMLNDWVARLPGLGIDTLLIEYEDKFPFKRYPFIRHRDAFSEDELRLFLATARGAGLTVIPLIQTYAHLEFALAHPQLAHLREREDIHVKICPAKAEAVAFVHELLDEILPWHEDDAYVHLGADETWHTDACPQCSEWAERDGVIGMWIQHERRYIDRVIAAGKTPIVWDDIFWRDFHAIEDADLPQETILHAWNYAIMALDGDDTVTDHLEFGGKAGALEQVEIYQAAGYRTLAAPCINYGQLLPRHNASLANTHAWAQKMARAGMMGMINTSWASFHVPLQTQLLQVAATGRACADADADLGPQWQSAWLAEQYDAPDADGVPAALETLGALFEVRVPTLGRPYTPIVYCYMNMELHFPDGLADRQRRGAYPRDWREVDFSDLYKRGLAEVCVHGPATLRAEVEELVTRYAPAAAAICAFAEFANARREEAAMLAAFARFKNLSVQILASILDDDGRHSELAAALAAQRADLKAAFALAFEPAGAADMMRACVQPLADRLAAAEHAR